MIDTGAGVIDADYRGIVYALLFNHSDTDFKGAFRQVRRTALSYRFLHSRSR